jgi:hypothetical protein
MGSSENKAGRFYRLSNKGHRGKKYSKCLRIKYALTTLIIAEIKIIKN